MFSFSNINIVVNIKSNINTFSFLYLVICVHFFSPLAFCVIWFRLILCIEHMVTFVILFIMYLLKEEFSHSHLLYSLLCLVLIMFF